MPTYAYACTACDHRFEAQQSFSDAALTECPQCTGRLRKLFNSVGIVFKGSGFYRTDSRAGGKGSTETPAAASTSGAGSSGTTSSGSGSSGSGSSGSASSGSSSGSSSSASSGSSGSGSGSSGASGSSSGSGASSSSSAA